MSEYTCLEYKNVIINGKRNQDKINNIEKPIRYEAMKYKFDISKMDHKCQINLVNKLFLNCDFDLRDDIIKIIHKKIQGYKSQDKNKNIWNEERFITKDETIEHLVVSRLKCHYCSCELYLLYDKVGEKKQWTLDRIDNTFGHFKDNVIVSCLECNIQRKNMDQDKFKFTKSLKIVKTS
jgi:hypothetical protein